MNVYVVAICFMAACTTSAEQTQAPRTSAPPATPAPAPSAPPAQTQQMPKGANVNPDAGVLADFKARVEQYSELRREVEKKAPPLKRTEDPGEIALAEEGDRAADSSRASNAKRGEFHGGNAGHVPRVLRTTVTGGADAADKKGDHQG